MKVTIIAVRKRHLGATVERDIEINAKGTDAEIKKVAELMFLNEYINRDCKIKEFSDLSEVKKFSGLSVKSKIKKS